MNKSALVTLEMDFNDNGRDEFPEYLRQMILNYLQYNKEFDNKCEKKILCLLTEIHDSNYSSENEIEVRNLFYTNIWKN